MWQSYGHPCSFVIHKCPVFNTLVLAVAQNLAENIVFRKFWLIQKIVHLDKYSLGLNVKNMISENTNANDI